MRAGRFALALAMSLAAGTSAAPALAQQKVTFAHVYEKSEAHHAAAVWAIGQILQRTFAKYKVEVHPASSLGDESKLNEALTRGTVDVIYTGQAFAGRTYGPISIGGAPYMFRDFNHWQDYARSALFRELASGYERASGGHAVVAISYYGTRQTTANRALNRPEDMKGLKIRVPEPPLYALFPRAVGAIPMPIAFAEVYRALQTRTVDAQENPLPAIEAKKFYEVQSHINMTAHITDALLIVVGRRLWSTLSESERQAFSLAFTEAAARATDETLDSERRLATEFAKRGKTVVNVDRKPFMAAVQKYYAEGKQPDGSPLPWPQKVYDRLQAIK